MTALAALILAQWTSLGPGVEYGKLVFDPKTKALIHVVRIDTSKAQLEFALRSREGGDERPAGQWADERGFVAVINAGMFETDHASNVGRLVSGKHENNAAWKGTYQSVLAFGGAKPAQVLDLDAPGAKDAAAQFPSMVQNLRLIKSPGVSVWKKNGRSWSETAIAQDKQGRILFLFTREPYEMAVWNELLLATPLEVQRAFHVEGGPEASLSLRSNAVRADFNGSYETGFVESDEVKQQIPIPNVIGVKAAAPSAPPAPAKTPTPAR